MGILLVTHGAAPTLAMGAVHLGRHGCALDHAPRCADHILDDGAVHQGRRGNSLGHAPRSAEHILDDGAVHLGRHEHVLVTHGVAPTLAMGTNTQAAMGALLVTHRAAPITSLTMGPCT